MDSYGVLYHIYEDDMQLYLSFQIGNLNQSRIKVENCIVAIKQWISDNMLKLNDSFLLVPEIDLEHISLTSKSVIA